LHIIIPNLAENNCVFLKDNDVSIYVTVIVEEKSTTWKVFFF